MQSTVWQHYMQEGSFARSSEFQGSKIRKLFLFCCWNRLYDSRITATFIRNGSCLNLVGQVCYSTSVSVLMVGILCGYMVLFSVICGLMWKLLQATCFLYWSNTKRLWQIVGTGIQGVLLLMTFVEICMGASEPATSPAKHVSSSSIL